MKRHIITILLFLLTLSANAQSLSVESFRLLENDLTANTYGTMERDQNGEIAALIKIITTETGFAFDGGMLGIVKTVQKVSEVWVYVPRGLQKIKIMHQQLGQVEYYFPIPIERARTYELRLISGRVRTIVEDEVAAQYVTFSVTPQNAIVTIDNTPYGLQADGTISQLLSYGTHSYRVDAPGYMSENGIVDVGRERIMREVNLKSSRGKVTLDCAMQEAEIYLNGTLVGKGSWTGELDAAMYQVEVRRESHTTRTTSFTLQPQDEKTVTLPLPQPIYGTISVTSQPIGATVFVDGVEVGTTPLLKGEILTGKRKVEFRKQDYRPLTMEVEVKEGEISTFNAEMSNVFTMTVKTEPEGASLSIDGKAIGYTPYIGEVSSGDYEISLTRSGYIPYKGTVHLDADNPELSFSLERRIFSRNNFYAGIGYEVGHVSGLDAFAGAFIGNFNIEGGYVLTSGKATRVWWIAEPSSWTGQDGLEYEYSLANAIAVHAGYGIQPANRFRVTPRFGLLFNGIEGKYCGTETGMDQRTFVVSGRLGVRAGYSPVPHVGIVCIPAYDFPLKKGELATRIDETSSLVKDWCGGFSFSIGVELFF